MYVCTRTHTHADARAPEAPSIQHIHSNYERLAPDLTALFLTLLEAVAGAGFAAGVAGLAAMETRRVETMESRLLAVDGAALAGEPFLALLAALFLTALFMALFLMLLGCVWSGLELGRRRRRVRACNVGRSVGTSIAQPIRARHRFRHFKRTVLAFIGLGDALGDALGETDWWWWLVVMKEPSQIIDHRSPTSQIRTTCKHGTGSKASVRTDLALARLPVEERRGRLEAEAAAAGVVEPRFLLPEAAAEGAARGMGSLPPAGFAPFQGDRKPSTCLFVCFCGGVRGL